MTANTYNSLTEPLMETMYRAGRAVMEIYGSSDFGAEEKADRTPVTEADKAAEALILADLAKVAPDIPVISEEAAAEGYIPEVADRFFLVDPLDGTKEFISRNGEFTLNIALIEAGVPVFGIVYAPAVARVFATLGPEHAVMGLLDTAEHYEGLSSANLQDIKIRMPDDEGLIAVTSRSHLNDKTKDYLAQYKIAGTTASGSSLKFCEVACGNADVYPRLARTMEWDTAAGHAVLKAAGGFVETEDGDLLTYGKKERGYDNPGFIAWGTKPAPVA